MIVPSLLLFFFSFFLVGGGGGGGGGGRCLVSGKQISYGSAQCSGQGFFPTWQVSLAVRSRWFARFRSDVSCSLLAFISANFFKAAALVSRNVASWSTTTRRNHNSANRPMKVHTCLLLHGLLFLFFYTNITYIHIHACMHTCTHTHTCKCMYIKKIS